MNHSTVFKVEYRARGYSEDDFRELASSLDSMGAVRFTPKHLPEAGGVTELWLAVEFIGTAALAGIIGHLATKFYDRLADDLLAFFRKKRSQNPDYPEFMSLTLSYDDLDIVISLPNEVTIGKLSQIQADILMHLSSPPLAENAIRYIVLPVAQVNGRWEILSIWNEASFTLRYWGVGTSMSPFITDVYDAQLRKLMDLPATSLPE